MALDRHLSLTTAADISGFSTKTLRRRIADGSLVARRIGPRELRIRESDLAAFLGDTK
ncbi:helix-turn-helix domain-containing protein [Gordonia sp. (in: high G+C Gram-positive bacteria)]|uniref:helix-turn-helix transcriptional regulator n=1 Tax=Gordonia sp. (in: high G+C Gram-positive bacteria) TaxID=84139 RepID=UPI00334253CF